MPKRINVSRASHRLLYFAPLFTTCFAVLTFGLFYRTFLYCPPDAGCTLIKLEGLFREIRPEVATSVAGYIGRVTWTLAGGLHVVVSSAALLVSSAVIYRALDSHGARVRCLIIGIALLVAANAGLSAALWTAADVSSPAQLLLQRTVAGVLPRINFYNRLFDALGTMVGVMLAVAACTIIWRNTDERQSEKELKSRLRLLRALLYAGAAALVIGVLRLGATLNWGGGFWVAGSEAGKEASSLITGIVSSLGISYTLFLVSMYLPTVLVLNSRARSLAETESPGAQGEWLKDNGLALSYLGYLPRLLALLGPILVGPVGQLLSKVGELVTPGQ